MCVYTVRETSQSDAKQPKRDVIDNLRKVANRSRTSQAVASFHLDAISDERYAYFEQATGATILRVLCKRTFSLL